MSEMLDHVADLPEVALGAGEILCEQDGVGGQLWILVTGELTVTKHGQVVGAIQRPGAVIGEVAVLLDRSHGATVTARVPSTLRFAADGAALLRSEPAITTYVAAGLAERLEFVSTYLADLKHQYGDAPGLAMIDAVVTELVSRQDPPARPGSLRDPDPEY